jgi:diamine N-acetyltransferase
MEILLKEVTSENWEECIDLKVSEEQKDFVSPNYYSLLQGKFEKECYPLCIYDGEAMVGFLMYDIDPDTNRLEMSRLMMDKNNQGKGYGKAAISKLFDLVREKYGDVEFYTSIEPENVATGKLYESMGFKKTGEIMWEEEVMVVQL